MSPSIAYGFKALKPITAWHDEREVTFQPGDEVPAGEWKGAAVEALIENGKIMRYATNVYEPGEFGGDAPPLGHEGGEPSQGRVNPEFTSDPPDVSKAIGELQAQIARLEQAVRALSGARGEPTHAPEPHGAAIGLSEDEMAARFQETEENASDKPFPQAQDGGFFVLSDGSRVRGKAKALAAQAALDVAAEGE